MEEEERERRREESEQADNDREIDDDVSREGNFFSDVLKNERNEGHSRMSMGFIL
jgi:hypothetical protein